MREVCWQHILSAFYLKVSYFPCTSEDVFTRYRMLDWEVFFSCNILKMWFHCLLASTFSDAEGNHKYCCYLYGVNFFKPWLLLRFSFHLFFLEASLQYCQMWFYLFLSCLAFTECPGFVGCWFRSNLEHFCPYFFKYNFLPDSFSPFLLKLPLHAH